jgi:hypothetical protein
MATFLGFNISVELPPFCGESAQKATSREQVGKGLGKCIFRNGLYLQHDSTVILH